MYHTAKFCSQHLGWIIYLLCLCWLENRAPTATSHRAYYQCPDWGALVGIHCSVQLWISGSVGGGSCRESGNSVLKEPFLPSQQTALQNVMWLCDDCDDCDSWYHTLLGTVIRWTSHAAVFIFVVISTLEQNLSEKRDIVKESLLQRKKTFPRGGKNCHIPKHLFVKALTCRSFCRRT